MNIQLRLEKKRGLLGNGLLWLISCDLNIFKGFHCQTWHCCQCQPLGVIKSLVKPGQHLPEKEPFFWTQMLTIEGLNEVLAFNHLTTLNCSVMRDLCLSRGRRATHMISPEKDSFFLKADFKVDVYQPPPPKIQTTFWHFAFRYVFMLLSDTENTQFSDSSCWI